MKLPTLWKKIGFGIGFLALLFCNSLDLVNAQDAGDTRTNGAAEETADERNGLELPIENPVDFIPELPDFSGGEAGENEGSRQIVSSLVSIITFMKYLAGVIAFTWFVWSGIRLVTAGEKEEQSKEAIEGLKYTGIALIFIVLVEPLITRSLLGGVGFAPGEQLDAENINPAILAGKAEILGLLSWVEAMVVFLGVAYLIFSAWKFLQDVGGEEEVSKQKKVLLWIAVGFIVIAVDEILIDQVLYRVILREEVGRYGEAVVKATFEQNPARGIAEFVGVMEYLLQFLAAIALAVIVYAGFRMITGFSNEENYEKSKKTLIAAGIGFLIILTSYILVTALISGDVS